MADIKVYQIGVGSFGQYGFEKLLKIHNYLQDVDAVFAGFAEPSTKKGAAAQRFAESEGVDLVHFKTTDSMYQSASNQIGKILIYDSGPSELHAENIYRSMKHGFYHLAEKPSSVAREQHIKAVKLAKSSKSFWRVNFIEMENPVVQKAIQLLQNKKIEHIEVFRENKAGILKLVHPVKRLGVQGGDILDKMSHELFVLAFLKAAGGQIDFNLQHVDNKYLTLDEINAGSNFVDQIGEAAVLDTVTQTTAVFDNDGVELRLHSSWGGLSRRCRKMLNEYEPELGRPIAASRLKPGGDYDFYDEEARFFIMKGEMNLLGDMLHNRLYNLNKGRFVQIPKFKHDTLYRSIKKAVLEAAIGAPEQILDATEIDVFINAIFNVRDWVLR
jgi:predicted dehydrogenase